jgi:hypothetical protein
MNRCLMIIIRILHKARENGGESRSPTMNQMVPLAARGIHRIPNTVSDPFDQEPVSGSQQSLSVSLTVTEHLTGSHHSSPTNLLNIRVPRKEGVR